MQHKIIWRMKGPTYIKLTRHGTYTYKVWPEEKFMDKFFVLLRIEYFKNLQSDH